MAQEQQNWGSRVGLVLAMAGNAVGLGNFLRFPVQAVQNGGGAFIIPYLICFVLMAIPLLWAEWAMGRLGGTKGHHSMPFIFQELDHKRPWWKYFGVFGIFTNLAVAAYYCYLESWTLAWVWHSISGTFNGLGTEAVADVFTRYLSVEYSLQGFPFMAVGFYLLCIWMNVAILAKGLSAGVETASKIGMPLLLIFGIFLAIKALTITPGEEGAVMSGLQGLNFLWEPQYSSLSDPKVWLAAAGQVFFTLSVGMGSIQCYASYVKKDEDIALNAMASGWMNEFVEVVIGSCILIPIAVGYLGIDVVVQKVANGGLGLAFQTMPYLFQQWGDIMAVLAGLAFFLLLFFAGITSSLAMGTPFIGFMVSEFNWTVKKSANAFGWIILLLGIPCVLFFDYGVFDEYDFWAGTFSLVLFATVEAMVFAWIFGMDKGWVEITAGADITVPLIFRFVLKYITPIMLLVVLLASLFSPEGGNWNAAFASLSNGNGWPLDHNAVLSKMFNTGLKQEIALASDAARLTYLTQKLYFVNGSRAILVLLYLVLAYLVYIAARKREHNSVKA